ncbi:mediator of DNA damage checkpoint protein 1 isoform 2-T2 [Pangshura tecta]
MTDTHDDQSREEKALRVGPGWPIRGLPAGKCLEGPEGLPLEQEAMEQTQLLEWEEDGDPPGGEANRPVGRLHLLSSKYGPEQDFWIYPGENVVGRLPSCRVCLPAPSVSKAHAVIEVPAPDGPHLLYDQGSLNRTRRQRGVLLPHVRYSLEDGDTLMFGDVGCQYFLLPPGGADPEDSLEVPPTQPRAPNTLAIEETPAPSKRMGYGPLLARDSEDEEELQNGGRLLHLPGSNGSDSSSDVGVRSDAAFSSPGATVVPESDEEGAETPDAPCPSLRLSYGSEQTPGPPENGVAALGTEQPRATGVVGTDLEPVLAACHLVKGPGHVGIALGTGPGAAVRGLGNGCPAEVGSITDVEEEEEVRHPDVVQKNHGPALLGDSDTDEEEEAVGNLDVVDPKCHPPSIEMGSDTDVEEEAAQNPDVHPKNHQLAGNGDSDTDVEVPLENPDVQGMKNQHAAPGDSDTDGEGAGVNPDVGPKSHQPSFEVDSDTDVEEEVAAKNPDVQKNHGHTLPRGSVADVEGEVENPDDVHPESHHSAKNGESDTDVEEVAENPDVVQISYQPAVEVGSDTDVEEEKAETPVVIQNNHQLVSPGGRDADVARVVGKPDVRQTNNELAAPGDSDTDVEESDRNPDVVTAKCHPLAVDMGSDTDVEETGNPDVGTKSHPLAIDVGSDTDVEEEEANNPNVVMKNHQHALPGDRDPDVTGTVGQPDVNHKGHQPAENEDSNTDVEESVGNPAVVQRSYEPTVEAGDDTDVEETEEKSDVGQQNDPLPVATGDSDTDVEENPDVGQQTLHWPTGDSETDVEGAPGAESDQAAGPVGGPAQAGGEQPPAAQTRPSPETKLMDTERNKEAAWGPAQPGDDSETDVEDDADFALQATQCYLVGETPSSGAEATRAPTAAGSVMSPPAGPALPAPVCTSSEKEEEDSDEDLCVVEATQSFCEDPRLHSDQPTQPFIPEEDTQLLPRPPPPGGALSQEPALPAVPGLASGGLLPLGTQTPTVPHLSPNESELPGGALPAGGAGRELPEEERSQPVCLVLSAPRRPALVLQGESRRAGAEPRGSSSGQRLRGQGGPEAVGRRETPAAVGVTGAGPHPTGARPEDAGKVPETHSSPSTPVRRRSLRSALVLAPPPPAPAPERRSRRGGAEKAVGSGEPSQPAPAAPQRRGRRQLCSPSVYMEAPEPGSVEEAEWPGPVKRPRRAVQAQDPPTEPEASSQGAPGRALRSQRAAGDEPRRGSGGAEPEALQGRARRSQRAPAQEPGPRRRGAAEPAREAQGKRRGVATPDPPPAQGEGRVGSVAAQEDAGSDAKKRQEAPVPPLRRQSTENKVEGLRARAPRRSQGAAGGTASPRVLFTGVIDEAGERVVSALGGALARSVFDCTHLVTDRVRRTVKFLCALARGVPIVTLDWLDKSGRSACFLSPSGFLVRDAEQERNFHFSLAQSLQRARRGALLQGYEIHVTPNVKPEPEHMKDIIQCSGGVFLPHMPRAYKDKRIVIACPEDLPRCRPALSARLPVASTELLLTGILQQALDLASYRLDGPPAPPPPSASAPATRASKRKGASGPAPALPSSAKRRR